MFRSFRPTLALGIALVAGSQALHANTTTEGPIHVGSVVVSYRDLNLVQDADAAILLGRLKDAAFQACGGDPRWDSRYRLMPDTVKRVYRECRVDAIARAVQTVNEPALSRVFHGDTQMRLAAK